MSKINFIILISVSVKIIRLEEQLITNHFLIKLGDFLNSDEYREPDWLVKMKELKKKLAGKY